MNQFFIDTTSICDKNTKIGKDTKIWHFCHIMNGAQIGKNCSFGQNVVVGEEVKIGNNCRIQNNVTMIKGLILKNDVFIGPSAVFTNDRNPRAFIKLSKHNYLPTLIKEGATIGANATLVCPVTIGKYAFIGAGSVVTKDVADFELVYGNPSEHQGWVCFCGKRLKEDQENKSLKCIGCGQVFLCNKACNKLKPK